MKTNEIIKKLVGNKIFSCEFIKSDGTKRKMHGRLKVKKHLKGGNLKHSPDELNYLIVYDLKARGYRTVNLNTLQWLKCGDIKL